jgi:hypothetical protein
MTLLDEGLYTYLSTYAGLVSLVSTRVYPFVIPEGATLPCVTFQRIDTPRELTHDTSGIGSSLAHPRFQFDAWATTLSSAKAIGEQIRAALSGKTGSIATGVTINASLVDNERPSYEAETKLFRNSLDFIIWHTD